MKTRLLGAISACLFTLVTTSSNAALVVPSGLNPGNAYHVIFVSSTTRDATSSNIADYDAHVQAAADAAGIGVDIGVEWRVLGSTATVDAIDHLAPLFSSTTDVPIYNQNGDLVSASFDALWDGGLDAPILYNENAVITPPSSLPGCPILVDSGGERGPGCVFTGTEADGRDAPDSEPQNSGALGNPLLDVTIGLSGTTTSEWTNFLIDANFHSHPFYALSSEIHIIPAPPAVWLFGSGLLGLIGIARKKAA